MSLLSPHRSMEFSDIGSNRWPKKITLDQIIYQEKWKYSDKNESCKWEISNSTIYKNRLNKVKGNAKKT